MTLNSKIERSSCCRFAGLLALAAGLILASTVVRADTGTCGGQSLTLPFTDVAGSNIFFCSIAQAFFTGLTNGTTATTYSPGANVTREQMAVFITRTQDSALKRGSRRAAVGEWAIPMNAGVLNSTIVGDNPSQPCFDGEDIWVPNYAGNSVNRVHASDGRALGTWTGAMGATCTIAAAGFIYVTGYGLPGKIYRINPSSSPGTVTEVASNVGDNSIAITFDGLNLWTANFGNSAGEGSITRYNIVTDVESTFNIFNEASQLSGIVFDGTSLWVSDSGGGKLYRVNPATVAIIETIDMGNLTGRSKPVFDGSNVWVPGTGSLSVVSTSTPARVVATLTGNGLDGTNTVAAFDGERVMVISNQRSVSLWKATSLTPLGTLALGSSNFSNGVCSDGLHFWITVDTAATFDLILRF